MPIPKFEPGSIVSEPHVEDLVYELSTEDSSIDVGSYWIWIHLKSKGSDQLFHARRHGRGMVLIGGGNEILHTADEIEHFINWLQVQLPMMRKAKTE